MAEIGLTDTLAQLTEPFPREAIKQREGGHGKMLDYVETETVIRRLNRVVGAWDFRITDKVWREFQYTDRNGQNRRNIVLTVFGEMSVPGLGTRAGTGVQIIEDGRGGEDMVKGAASDCLKKCATLFGVGLELYGPDIEAGEAPQPQQFQQRANGHAPANLPPRGRTEGHNTMPANGNGQRPQIQNPDGPPSDKQVQFLGRLLSDAEWTGEHADAWLMPHGGRNLESMTKGDASALIEYLKGNGPRPNIEQAPLQNGGDHGDPDRFTR